MSLDNELTLFTQTNDKTLKNVLLYDANGNSIQVNNSGQLKVDLDNISTENTSQIITSLSVTNIEKINPLYMSWFTETNQNSINTLAVNSTKYAYTVTLTNATQYSAGNNFAILTPTSIYTGFILSKTDNTLTLDSPLNFSYLAGSTTLSGSVDMNVDGSVTPRIFRIRDPESYDPTGLEIVIHRILFTCYCDSAVDLSKFGNLAALTRGILLRQSNGITTNIFNIKDNGELGNICYDLTIYGATNPAQGLDGFVARLTFGGNSKMGSSILLKDGEILELLVQDDLTDLVKFRCMAQGYIRII